MQNEQSHELTLNKLEQRTRLDVDANVFDTRDATDGGGGGSPKSFSLNGELSP